MELNFKNWLNENWLGNLAQAAVGAKNLGKNAFNAWTNSTNTQKMPAWTNWVQGSPPTADKEFIDNLEKESGAKLKSNLNAAMGKQTDAIDAFKVQFIAMMNDRFKSMPTDQETTENVKLIQQVMQQMPSKDMYTIYKSGGTPTLLQHIQSQAVAIQTSPPSPPSPPITP